MNDTKSRANRKNPAPTFNRTILVLTAFLIFLSAPFLVAEKALSAENTLFAIRVDQAVPNFTLLPFNRENVKKLIERIVTMREKIEKTLAERGKSPEKISQSSEIIACELIEGWLKKILAGFDQQGINMSQLEKSYILVMRVWYSLDAYIQIWPKATTAQIAAFCLRTASILAAAPVTVKIPSSDPDSVVGPALARLEAPYLYDEQKKPVSLEKIATMTHREVSRLEPLEESNVYRMTNKISPDSYRAFEKEIEEMVRTCPGGDPDFSFEKAKKCFTFDHFLTSGSHPKISAEDRYGFKWKIKFGEEMHTELFATRLYMILGGRYADLKYYIPAATVPLVLEPPARQGEDPKAISYFYQLVEAFAPAQSKSKALQFHIADWILPQNLIKDDQGRILGNGVVDEAFLKKYGLKKKYLGAYYLYFIESTMSFTPPAIKKLGAASFSGLGANQSRAARGSITFNLFLASLDAKDDNCQMSLLYNPQTGKFDRPIEYQSDLGCVMGSPLSAGEINSFEWEWLIPLPGFIGFNVKIMYYPDAWKNATFADAMWMARKIAAIDVKTFEWLAAESHWEPFVQALAVEKIKSRRNQMVKFFGLDREGVAMMPVDRNLTITMPGHGTELDSPVQYGVIVSPQASRTVRSAEERHPEGIFNVKNPFND